MPFEAPSQPLETPQFLLTAAEAYPVLERAFLNARKEIWAGFRIFDLDTKLRSEEGRAIGETWFDLVWNTLARGVAIHMFVTDFDPVACPELHQRSWHTMRQFRAAGEAAGRPELLDVDIAMHPARTGLLPRATFLPQIGKKLGEACEWLNGLDGHACSEALEELPGLRDVLYRDESGKVCYRLTRLPILYPATHHQKLAVFDRETLYIGGLDLNERRYDTPEHRRPGEDTWHDVQLLLSGEVAKEAQHHLEEFRQVCAGEAKPTPAKTLIRTLSSRRKLTLPYFGPVPVLREIRDAHVEMAERAERFIFVETQFFRDRRFARRLARIGRNNPDLEMIMIVPAAPEEVAFENSDGLDAKYGEALQAESLQMIQEAFGGRLFVGAAAQPRANEAPDENGRNLLYGAPLVYIHSKVTIFDEREAIVSSANLNGRSLGWDTEAGVKLTRHEDVVRLRDRVMRHWLPDDAEEKFFDPTRAVSAWRQLALENASREPAERRGFVLPYDREVAERFGTSYPGVPEELV